MLQAYVSQKAMHEIVAELTKEKPDMKVVKKLSEELSLPYSADPLVQINTVLQAFSNLSKNSKPDFDLEVI